MWRKRQDEPEMVPRETPVAALEPKPAAAGKPPAEGKKPMASTNTQIGQTVALKGEISARENLLIDGEVEGSIELQEASLTVGQHGRVTADIRAKEIIIDGAVKGNLYASERIEIRRSGSVVGDLVSARVMIEDGAYFKGSVDIVRQETESPRAPAESLRMGMNVPVEAKDLSRSAG